MYEKIVKGPANYKHKLLLADPPYHDDLYLVSFPKSGVTWLSFLMANIHLQCSRLDATATFFNLESYIPDIHLTRSLKDSILTFPGFRIIKSHSEYNPFYRRIIYLMRDPKDVMVSYYYFMKKLGWFNGSISELIRSKSYGIDAWCRHTQSWLNKTHAFQQINVIKYEDMKREPRKVLDRVYSILGFKLPQIILDEAIDRSAFDEMKKNEEYCIKWKLSSPKGYSFMRKGITGDFKSELTEADVDYIQNKAKHLLEIFNYEDILA